MSLREMAERVTHRLVLRRRLPEPFEDVRLYVSSEGGLRYLKPRLTDVDPMLLRLVDELVRPGMTVWDIGANVGLFAFPAAARAGRQGAVVAVEADAYNVSLLRRSARAQPPGSAPVTVVPSAASDAEGFATFHIAARNRSTNYLDGHGTSQTGGSREAQTVPTCTLDGLLDHFPTPDVVKIDVEGAEALVLTGARRLLSEVHPVVLCEVAGENHDEVRGTLEGHGFDLYDAEATEPGSPLPAEGSANVLAVPRTPR